MIVQAVASLDGFIARPDDLPGPIFDWYEAGDVEPDSSTPTTCSTCRSSPRDYLDVSDVRCQVIGRHLFDFIDGWGGDADRRATASSSSRTATPTSGGGATPTRRTRSAPTASRTPYASATEHAGDGTVLVCAGEVGGQVVAAGLADELAIDLAPVFLGRGKKFLGLVHRRDRPRRPARGRAGRARPAPEVRLRRDAVVSRSSSATDRETSGR